MAAELILAGSDNYTVVSKREEEADETSVTTIGLEFVLPWLVLLVITVEIQISAGQTVMAGTMGPPPPEAPGAGLELQPGEVAELLTRFG